MSTESWPLASALTNPELFREAMVVEPLLLTLNNVLPLEEVMVKSGTLPGWPTKVKVEEVDVVPMARACKFLS